MGAKERCLCPGLCRPVPGNCQHQHADDECGSAPFGGACPISFSSCPSPTASLLFIFDLAGSSRRAGVSPVPSEPRGLSHGLHGVGYKPVALWFPLRHLSTGSSGASQSLLLVGTVIMLPVVLAYTAFCYYLFGERPPMKALTDRHGNGCGLRHSGVEELLPLCYSHRALPDRADGGQVNNS